MDTKYKFINFVMIEEKLKRKAWSCRNNKSNDELGIVKWYSGWRQYCYFPTVQAVYSRGCLDDINCFLIQITTPSDHGQPLADNRKDIEQMEKPTIEELEEILDGRDRHLVLNPDGSISTGEIKEETQGHSKSTVVVDRPLLEAAKNLFDNRLGWSDNRNPYAPRKFWADLSAVLYGEDDERTQELRK